jgi:hypothetical protein
MAPATLRNRLRAETGQTGAPQRDTGDARGADDGCD